jgi:hypothetical protein
MPGHGGWVLGELIAAGFVTLAVVLIALLAIAAALHAGRTHDPVPLRVRSEDGPPAGGAR